MTHLKLLDKMYKYEIDPTRTVGTTEQTWMREGRKDGRTEWNQYIPQQFRCAAGIISSIILTMLHRLNDCNNYMDIAYQMRKSKHMLLSNTQKKTIHFCTLIYLIILCIIMWIKAISNCLNKKYDKCVIILLLAELVMKIEGLILHMHRHNSKEKKT